MGKSTPPIDMRRVIRAAVDAALEDPVPRPRRKRGRSTGRVLLVGAGLMTAGLAARSRGRAVFGTLRDRVEDVQDRFLGSDDDLPEDEGELDEQEELDAEEEEPQAEAVDDEFEEGEPPGDLDDEELDGDKPEPELDDDKPPSRKAPTRRRRGRT